MHRIRIQCQGVHDERPHAPFLGGEVEVFGHRAQVVFLIDTGADHSVVDANSLRLPSQILRQGSKHSIRGVGGTWPSRHFQNVKFTFLGENEQGTEVTLQVPLPTLSVMAPRAILSRNDDGIQVMEEYLRPMPVSDRRRQTNAVRECTPLTPLLGRDVFYDSRLRFEWSPTGDSWIYLLDEPARG